MYDTEKQGLLTLKEAANFLGVKSVTLRKWDNEGKLKAVRIGARQDRRYRMEDLVKMIDATVDEKVVWQEYLRKKITVNIIAPIIDGVTRRLAKYWQINYHYHMSYGGEDFYYYCCSEKDNILVGEKAIELYLDGRFARAIKAKWINFFKKIYHLSEAARVVDWKKYPLKSLIRYYQDIVELNAEYAGMSIVIDGVDEAGVIHLSKLLKAALVKHPAVSYSEAFDVFSAPSVLSAASERDRSIGILAKKARTKKIAGSVLEKELKALVKKYWWLDLAWYVYDADFDANIRKSLNELAADSNLDKKLNSWEGYHGEMEAKKNNLAKKIGLNKDAIFQKYVRVVGDFTLFHDWRKEFQMRGMYVQMAALKEIGRRLKISIDVLEWATPDEVVELAGGVKLDLPGIYRRSRGYLILVKNNRQEMFTGEEAEKRWAKERVATIQVLNDLQGISASRGKVTGEAYVTLSAVDAMNIKEGQILVTSQTTPDFIPAMKKAAAIVTDEGGLTSHAAIIARELGIPCVIGTKYATRILRTGQLIEVAANHGVVRILK